MKLIGENIYIKILDVDDVSPVDVFFLASCDGDCGVHSVVFQFVS